MQTLRDMLWRAFVYAALVVSLFTLARVIFPGLFEFWASTTIGGQIDQIGTSIAAWLFLPGAPLAPVMETTDRMVGFVRIQLTTGNLISAILGAIGVGGFNLLYNWWRNRSIRRMCSAMLYSAGYRILVNIGAIYAGFTRNGKPYWDSFTGEETRTLTLNNNKDVRAAFHRLKCEMETLQDFSIAYDYAIWRGLRFLTAKARIRAMAVREALEVTVAELDFFDDGKSIDFRPARLGVKAAMAKDRGNRSLDLTDALYPVLSVTVDLAERLEVGFFRSFLLWWWPATGRSMPRSAPKLRADVQQYLIKWRHNYWAQELENDDSWDTLWVAAGAEARPRWNREVYKVIQSVS